MRRSTIPESFGLKGPSPLAQQWSTFRGGFNRRGENVPYFASSGGVTPPGGNQSAPGSVVQDWAPGLRKTESRMTFAMLVKF